MFPVVTVTGSAYERGRQYGEQARGRVHRSVAQYADMFGYLAGWDWSRATAEAQRFVPSIDGFAPQYLDEMRGLAEGAGVSLEDIVAVNVRTEVMSAARVRAALAGRGMAAPEECSVFANSAPGQHVLAGQNWDWLPFARDTVVVVRARPDDGPSYITVVEAGLLAKFGVNSDGFAVMTNALACTEDNGNLGVPYHVMLRALLDCATTQEGLTRLRQAERASSANYLLVDETGDAVDVEARPGGASALHELRPDRHGMLLHTNHFVSPEFDSIDYADLVASTSQFRLKQMTSQVTATTGDSDAVEVETFSHALSDHTEFPDSVCRHPDLSLPPQEQTLTVASAVVDLTERRMWLSEGPPCERGYEELDVSTLGATTVSP
ncbi:MAG: C45 family autoproteolytic acyltransferase/hydrolase [Nocardioidaceae bacterium]